MRDLEKRYQVFLSSTYEDLKDERREATKAILELKCFPASMELFPATSYDQWKYIKQVIDESDYFLLIVAGRYGSVVQDEGISYTEKEYDYAVSSGKPAIVFLHHDIETLPGAKLEKNDKAKKKLEQFRSRLQGKGRLVRFYSNPAELAKGIYISLDSEFKFSPATGWVRGQTGITNPDHNISSNNSPEGNELPFTQLKNKEYSIEIRYGWGSHSNNSLGFTVPRSTYQVTFSIADLVNWLYDLRHTHFEIYHAQELLEPGIRDIVEENIQANDESEMSLMIQFGRHLCDKLLEILMAKDILGYDMRRKDHRYYFTSKGRKIIALMNLPE